MCRSVWKSPVLSNRSEDAQAATRGAGGRSRVVNGRACRGESADARVARGCTSGGGAERAAPLPSCASVPRCLPVSQHVMMSWLLGRGVRHRVFIPTSLSSTCVSRCVCVCARACVCVVRGGPSLGSLAPLTHTALPRSGTPPFHTGPCCWALGCHGDGCQVPEADSQRWGCRLHPRGRLRGASHCVEKGMLP